MEKELQQLLETALRERFELADSALRKESDDYKLMAKRLVALSQKIHSTTEMSEAMKAEIADYLSLVAEMDDVFKKHIYQQGAKDCVAMLRELDLIK